MKPKYGKPDKENPEITRDDFSRMRPAHEVFPDIFTSDNAVRLRRRGPQKSPTKQLVSLRLERDTIDAYRATGAGWQGRISEDLDRAAKRRRRQ